MEFVYVDINKFTEKNIKEYMLNTKIIDVQCKHYVSNKKNQHIAELADNVGYRYAVFGSHRKANFTAEKNRIMNMKSSSCERAVRFVIDKNSRMWSDNTHWSIAYILKYGSDITLKDIPCYIVDFREDVTKIININHTVFDSVECIETAINNARHIQQRIELGWRNENISYCLNELIEELDF